MSFLIFFQNILFSYSHHDKYEFYLYSILLYNKKQENYYIGGIADYVDKKSQSDSYNLHYGMGNFLYIYETWNWGTFPSDADGSAYRNRISDSGTYIFQKVTES